ncbi:MAG: ATP-binding protein [Candidatus Lokiarchaeota archaeon]|nr:ATP-binding protein [Candidatus Lokiarchaeota archaeon]
MKKRNFNKQVLTRFIQTECKRQLFLDLSQTIPKLWRDPNRLLVDPQRIHRSSENLTELGRRYEQSVYEQLINLKGATYQLNPEKNVKKSYLNPILLLNYYNQEHTESMVLLEHEYRIPPSFFIHNFFPGSKTGTTPFFWAKQRPDLMIIRHETDLDKQFHELLADGALRAIPREELKTRYSISVIDIKNIRDENIGKKQFIEVLYYMFTLTHYLIDNKLSSKFFVNIEYNGIIPRLNEKKLLEIKNIEDLIPETITVQWEESNLILRDVISQIKNLWKLAPCDIDDIPVNIQPNCGFCYFIEDCKDSLGMDGKTKPNDWDLALIPYTTMSIAQQLRNEYKFSTIDDIASRINTIHIGDTPKPIYSELPLLELKARAIIEDKMIKPKPGQIHAYSIPKYSTIGINLAVETDPANQRVYAAGLFLFMSVHSKAPYSRIYENWWRIWNDWEDNSKSDEDFQLKLNEHLVHEIPLHVVHSFRDYLEKLKKVKIYLAGDKKSDGTLRKQTVVLYQFANINEDDSDETEGNFAVIIILRLYYLLEMCNIIENYVVIDAKEAGRYYGPSTSLFYWSKRQLNNFQDMLERNLNYIINNQKVAVAFDSIISLFTPSDSEVSHPYQHKKLFNVQEFAESVFGFPSIISYTWHEIAKKEFGHFVKQKYWIPHFNYMDFNNWYEFILEKEDKEKRELKKKEIIKQVMVKVRTINALRNKFQNQFSNIISKNVRVINKTQFNSIFLSTEFHPISQVWYLFSKYTGAMEEMDTEYFRTTFPEFSIGKLAAAQVEDLRIWSPTGKKNICDFKITSLSSNMNINPGDRVYLLPDNERDANTIRKLEQWKIIIKEMVWDPKINGYYIFSQETNSNRLDEYKGIENHFSWFIYHTSMDVWSNKLYKKNGLLERCNLGKSWLGFRLSYLWNIRSKQELYWPYNWEFSTPSVYLYLPEVISSLKTVPHKNLNATLLTAINPIPDESQVIAINNSLNHVISGIQGPPGTGKSQTIAALIDEYYERCLRDGKKTVRILVTCFSYAALKVVLEKIRIGKDKLDNHTKSSHLQLVYLRSEYQKKIESKNGCRDVDDLLRKGTSWKLNGKIRTVTNKIHLEESLEKSFIIFANAHQLYHLVERVDPEFAFDLVIVDEASQVPIHYFLSSLQFIIKKNIELKPKLPAPNSADLGTLIKDKSLIEEIVLENKLDPETLSKVIIVGDYNQLPPVQPIKPPKNLEDVLGSLFTYYVRKQEISNVQLKVNYRSHQDIVDFTSALLLYEDITPCKENAQKLLEGKIDTEEKPWIKTVLDPQKVVSVILHEREYEIGVSALEAELVSKLTISYFKIILPRTESEEINFWKERLGVVAPHNAQGRLIIRKIFDGLTGDTNRLTNLENTELMKRLRNTVYSVEKFQGSDRDIIIASFGLSDKDQLDAESEFIYNLNRFNVLTSRAKYKLILVMSKKFLGFIPNDRTIMTQAAHIRKYAYTFCNEEMLIDIVNEKKEKETIAYRYKK